MTLFTDAELRVLRLGDKGLDARRVTERKPRGPSGRVGILTDNEALLMHADGKTTGEMAAAAGVSPQAITRWKRARGFHRPCKPTGIKARTPAEYKRLYYLLLVKRSAT